MKPNHFYSIYLNLGAKKNEYNQQNHALQNLITLVT